MKIKTPEIQSIRRLGKYDKESKKTYENNYGKQYGRDKVLRNAINLKESVEELHKTYYFKKERTKEEPWEYMEMRKEAEEENKKEENKDLCNVVPKNGSW